MRHRPAHAGQSRNSPGQAARGNAYLLSPTITGITFKEFPFSPALCGTNEFSFIVSVEFLAAQLDRCSSANGRAHFPVDMSAMNAKRSSKNGGGDTFRIGDNNHYCRLNHRRAVWDPHRKTSVIGSLRTITPGDPSSIRLARIAAGAQFSLTMAQYTPEHVGHHAEGWGHPVGRWRACSQRSRRKTQCSFTMTRIPPIARGYYS